MATLADVSTIAIGEVLDGKYEITDILGEGAMGVVYLALHQRLQRVVALKTLRAEFAADAELIERFEREARAASAIGHPNIVQVFDAGGEPGGVPYLVMESLKGQSLGDILRGSGPLQVSRAIDVCCQVLAGLGAAHAAGILHRDLKPDNIFVTTDAEGHDLVKILDFGISKILDVADPAIVGDSQATRVGTVLGTPMYMSPEQACGRADLDSRADLWAVVCVLYECLSGKTPFTGENYNQILAAVIKGEFVGLKEHCPHVPMELHELVQRGLKVEREDRFSDATSLSVALASIAADAKTSDGKAGGKGQDDPNMLAAFDNIAERFVQQEKEDSVDMEVPLAQATPIGSSAGPSTPAPDRFAPPGSDEQVSLALDIEPSAERPSLPLEVSTPALAPRMRRPSQVVTRKESSGVGAAFAKLLLLMVVVAGAGAGYRYYTLGYIIPPTLPAPATLALEVQPEGAQVFLNDELKDDRSLSLVAGQSYALRISASGRLDMFGRIDAQPGTEIRASVSMGHNIFSITPSIVAESEIFTGEAPERASIDAARDKLDAFGDCGLRLSAALAASLNEDKPTTLLEPLPRALTDECGLTLDLAVDMEPAMELLDKASKALRSSIADHSRAILEHRKSKGASRKVMRARERSLRKAMQQAQRSAHSWPAVMSGTQARWLSMEALRVQSDEGDTLHSQLRNLAVSSDAWMRTHLAGKNANEQRAAMIDLFAIVTRAAEQRPELFKSSGASTYLSALKPLIDKEPGEDALFWHNQAVDMFNKLRLPIALVLSESQDRQ